MVEQQPHQPVLRNFAPPSRPRRTRCAPGTARGLAKASETHEQSADGSSGANETAANHPGSMCDGAQLPRRRKPEVGTAADDGTSGRKRARFKTRDRSCEQQRVCVCTTCVAMSADKLAKLIESAILHLLFARGQIPNIWSALQQQPSVPQRPDAMTASQKASSRPSLAQRRVQKYIDGITALLTGVTDIVTKGSPCARQEDRNGGSERQLRRRVLLVFGSSPICPLELFELHFSCLPRCHCPSEHAIDDSAQAHKGTDKTMLSKLVRQLLRGIVQDVQPRRELRCTKLWVMVELLEAERISGAAVPSSACPVRFAVKRNVDVALLRRRAKSFRCKILVGMDDDESRAETQQEDDCSSPTDNQECTLGGVWAQSISAVAALPQRDWNAAGYQ